MDGQQRSSPTLAHPGKAALNPLMLRVEPPLDPCNDVMVIADQARALVQVIAQNSIALEAKYPGAIDALGPFDKLVWTVLQLHEAVVELSQNDRLP
jgi:hypothetical protein